MDYIHVQKNVTTSPRKLRLVADMVRKMGPEKAVEILQFTNKAAAKPLAKAIKTAIANAGKDGLVFKALEINEGSKLKRYRVGTAGRGRGRPYRRRWSHIKIVLSDEVRNIQKGSVSQNVRKSDASYKTDKPEILSNSEFSGKKGKKVK